MLVVILHVVEAFPAAFQAHLSPSPCTLVYLNIRAWRISPCLSALWMQAKGNSLGEDIHDRCTHFELEPCDKAAEVQKMRNGHRSPESVRQILQSPHRADFIGGTGVGDRNVDHLPNTHEYLCAHTHI